MYTGTYFVFYMLYMYNSATGWSQGLGGLELINDGIRCTVPIPTYSMTAAYNMMVDRAKHSPKCEDVNFLFDFSNFNASSRTLDKIERIGFPRIEHIDDMDLVDHYRLQTYVRGHMVDMDDPDVPQSVIKGTEFTLNVSDSHKHILEF